MATSPLTDFNDMMEMMLEDLEESFPAHKQLTKYKIAISYARKANPRLVLNRFAEYLEPIRERILKCDEEFFLKTTAEDIQGQGLTGLNGAELSQQKIDEAMGLKQIWLDVNTTNRDKACIWGYFHQLIELSDKAARR